MRDYRLTGDPRTARDAADREAPTVGRATLVEPHAVQARGSLAGPDVHATAARGVTGAGGRLPFADTIQRSFGRHDITNVRAHVGAASADAAHAIGAQAYTVGESVAFAAAPDLHLAAHEAAHVVQQRRGVRLFGGVGCAGDEYERHADAVADRVVQGLSAEPLLDELGRGTPATAVQRDEPRQRRPIRRVTRTISNLRLASVLPELAIGESCQLKLEVRIPVDGLYVGGTLVGAVERSDEGYQVAVTPRLAFGVGTTTNGGVFVEERVTVRGPTRADAGGLFQVALDRTIRHCSREIPRPVIAALFALSPLLIAGDAALRIHDYARMTPAQRARQVPQSRIWELLADALFRRADVAATTARMGAHDYVETRDRIGVEGETRSEGASPRSSGAELLHENRWRLEGTGGAREYSNSVIETTITIDNVKVKVRYQQPARDPSAFGGACEIELSLGTRTIAIGLVTTALIRHVYDEIAHLLDPGRRSPLLVGSRIVETWIVTAAQAALASIRPSSIAKLALGITIPFDGTPITGKLGITSALDGNIAHNGLTYTHGRELAEWTIEGVAMSGRPHR